MPRGGHVLGKGHSCQIFIFSYRACLSNTCPAACGAALLVLLFVPAYPAGVPGPRCRIFGSGLSPEGNHKRQDSLEGQVRDSRYRIHFYSAYLRYLPLRKPCRYSRVWRPGKICRRSCEQPPRMFFCRVCVRYCQTFCHRFHVLPERYQAAPRRDPGRSGRHGSQNTEPPEAGSRRKARFPIIRSWDPTV